MIPKKVVSRKKAARNLKLARQIATHHLGDALPTKDGGKQRLKISPLSGGLTNHVFCVHHKSGNVILRMAEEPGKINSFMKEQWAIARARELGVPAPEVLQVGDEGARVPYMIARQAKGMEAAVHPKRIGIVKEMGRYAAMIHSIGTTGFGSTFDWSPNRLSHNATWAEFLENELRIDEALEVLRRAGMLSAARLHKLRVTLRKAGGKRRAPVLNHGDLRLKNVLVDEKGKISCILDWENCTSSIAPEWDFALALHDLAIDEKQAFLKGYGFPNGDLPSIAATLKALTLINYAPWVRTAMKAGKADELECFRVRLNGDLDLFSL